MEDNKNIKSDYDYSRETYYNLLEKGGESLDLMIEVARAFEVLSNMMKNLAEINDKLMDLNKKNKDISKETVQATKQITNNNVFMGSTTDLQRFLQNEQKVIDVTPESNE